MAAILSRAQCVKQEAMHITTFHQLGIAKWSPKQELIDVITKSKETNELCIKSCITQHGMNIALWKKFSCMKKIAVFWFKFHWCLVQSVQLTLTVLGNGLASKLLHITFTIVSHMATLGLNELNEINVAWLFPWKTMSMA